MMILERIQTLIHKLEVDAGARRLNYLATAVAVAALAVWYDTHCYRGFSAPEAMDMAQVARNVSEGKGFTTECVRPFSIYLLQKHNHAVNAGRPPGTNAVDYAEIYGPHPDLANPPVYPALLAGLFKVTSPDWKLDLKDTFWGGGGRFQRYKPEFMIAVLNQLLMVAAVWLTFMVARLIFDATLAWLAALLMFGSDLLWKFSISGLPTLLLLVIFLGVVWCLVSFEVEGAAEHPDPRRRFRMALLAGFLAGLGMLTQYSFGWVIVPVVVYLAIFGGARRAVLAVAALMICALTVSPWIARNLAVSGTFLGTAGYAVAEGTIGFPGSRLMQSLHPDMANVYWVLPYLVKLQYNLRSLLQNNVPTLGGGWIGILFLAGLLLGLRNVVTRRLRYFTMMCLGVFLVVTALGQTAMGQLSSDTNPDNLLVLLMPLVAIFGLAFFLTLLNQMDLPSLAMRFLVTGVVVVFACQQLLITLLPPKTSLVAWPPYNPPDIQVLSGWLQPDELVMSDLPWAVAWYGDRKCTWTTLNSQYEFVELNDFVRPVNALYLSINTIDVKMVTDCAQGGVDNWSAFAFNVRAYHTLPNLFPLRQFPAESFVSGYVLFDRIRWQVE
jgi:hypothetical protein